MLSVVAVLHVHARELTELHGQRNFAAGLEPVHVLPAPLCQRHIAQTAIASENLAFFEVDVDGVIPAAAAVLKMPYLAGARLRHGREAAEVGRETLAAIRLDCPGEVISAAAAPELEGAFARDRNL